MAKYLLTTTGGEDKVVDADSYQTIGDFVDFMKYQDNENLTVLRWRKEYVFSIELQPKD